MRQILVTYLVFISLICTTCSVPRFNKQKYTNLKPLSESTIEPVKLDLNNPPDSLENHTSDSSEFSIYLQTEKGYYLVDQPRLDTSSKIVSAKEIRRSTAPDSTENPVIIKITEKNYYLIDAVELNKVDGIYYKGEIIPKDEFSKYLPADDISGTDAVEQKKQKESKGFKIASIILGVLGLFTGLIALFWYNEANQTDDSGCLGAMIAASFLATAILFAYAAGLLLVLALVFLIVYIVNKNA